MMVPRSLSCMAPAKISLAEAEVAKTQLQDAEIWVDIRNEFMSALNSVGGAATLVVRTEDLEHARRVLELE